MGIISKLSKNDVIKIKKLLNEGKTQKTIAKMFNINQTTVSNIKVGKTWKNV